MLSANTAYDVSRKKKTGYYFLTRYLSDKKAVVLEKTGGGSKKKGRKSMSIASITVFSLPTSLTFEHYGLCRTVNNV
jgi:hypothetical protein